MNCPHCGAAITERDEICPECYAPLDTAPATQVISDSSSTFIPLSSSSPQPEPGRRAASDEKPAPLAQLSCSGCGAAVEADDKFCPDCGTARETTGETPPSAAITQAAEPEPIVENSAEPVAAIGQMCCPSCNADVFQEDRFCPDCGSHLKTSEARPDLATPSVEYSVTLSQPADLNSSSALEAEVPVVEMSLCPCCGSSVPKAESFCPDCGSVLSVSPTIESSPEPVVQPAPPEPFAAAQSEVEYAPPPVTLDDVLAQAIPVAPEFHDISDRSPRCSNCGAALLADDKFCPDCGTFLSSPEAPSFSAASDFGDLERPAMPKHDSSTGTSGLAAFNLQPAIQTENSVAEGNPPTHGILHCPSCGEEIALTESLLRTCGVAASVAPAGVVKPEAEPSTFITDPLPAAAPPIAPSEQTAICASCGAEVLETDKFCPDCGAASGAAPAAPSYAPRQPEPALSPIVSAKPAAPASVATKQKAASDGLMDALRPYMVASTGSYVSDKRVVIKNPEKHTYLEMNADDLAYLELLDGEHTVTDILKETFDRTGQMCFKSFYNLLVELRLNEFLSPDGMESLDDAIGKNVKTSRGAMARFTAAVERLAVPLPPVALLMKAFSYPLRLFLNLPMQLFVFLLCVAPVALASLLEPVAAKHGPIVAKIYSIMSLFGAPNQKGYNIFMYDGSYVKGVLLAYLAAFCALSFRSLARGAALFYMGCEPYRPALRFYYGIMFIDVDGRDAVMADRKGRMVFHAAGILSTLVIGTAINIEQRLFGFSHPLYLIYIVAYLITFLNLCVFFKSDLFLLIDDYFETPHLRKHADVYVRRNFLRQVLSFKSSFPEEKPLTAIACAGLLWLYLAVNVFFSFMRDNLALLTNEFSATTSWPTRIAIAVFLASVAGPFSLLVLSLVGIVLRNAATVLGTPLGRMLRKLGSRRGRKPASPDEISNFLGRIPLFMGMSAAERHSLASHFREARFSAGANVVVQGDRGDAFYIILEGKADVIIVSPSGLKTTVDTLELGDSFGEIALLEKTTRTATIRAATPLVVLELDKMYFDKFVSQTEGSREKITEVIRLTALLRKIPFFNELPPSRIPDIIGRLKRIPVAVGTEAIREGERGDDFFIIAEGKFQVQKNEPEGGRRPIATLGPNETFGEIALLKNIPRTSSVVAETDGVLLALAREAFLSVAHSNLHAGILLEEKTERRLEELKRKAG